MSRSEPQRLSAIMGVVAVGSALWFALFRAGTRLGAPLGGLAVASMVIVAVGGRSAALSPRRTPALPGLAGAPRVARLAAHVGVGVGLGLLTVAATTLLWPAVRALLPTATHDVRALYAAIPVTPKTVPVVLLVVVAEEVLWRGSLLRAHALGTRELLALACASTLLYALAQTGSGIALVGAAGVLLGSLWAAEAILTGSLLAPLVSHALWTLSVFWWTPLER